MRAFASAAFFLLLVCLSSAQIGEPFLVSELEGTVVEEGSVFVKSGTVYSMKINLSVPLKSSTQDAFYSGQVSTDSEGNAFSLMAVPNPPNPFPYRVETRVVSRSKSTSSLPSSSYAMPVYYGIFTFPTQRILSNESAVRALALSLTENSSSDFEKIARLAIFTHNYITYDVSLGGELKDSNWVLQNKRGVCIEYSVLFAALARSLNYPVRIISGYAVSKEGEWQGHAWNDVYIGEWVPVDATWLEVGWLDATHIELFKSREDIFGASLAYTATPGAQLDWKSQNPLGISVQAVQPTRMQNISKKSDYTFSLAASSLAPGQETLAFASFSSPDYRVVETQLEPCSGPEAIASIPVKWQAIPASPGQERVVAWRVQASSSLSPSFTYFCPLTLNSPFLQEQSPVLQVDSSAPTASIEAWPAKSSLAPGAEQTIFLRVKTGSPSKMGVATSQRVFELPASSSTQGVSFTPLSLGRNTAYAFTDQGSVAEVSFDVIQNSSLEIKDFTTPSRLLEGSLLEANATLSSTSASPQSIRATLSLDSESTTQSISLKGTQSISLSVSANTPGDRLLTLGIESGSTSLQESRLIHIVQKPVLSLGNASFSFEGDSAKASLSFSFTGEPKQAQATIEGKSLPIDASAPSTFTLSPGKHSIQLTWLDEFGNSYSKQEELDVPSKPSGCFASILLLASFFALASWFISAQN